MLYTTQGVLQLTFKGPMDVEHRKHCASLHCCTPHGQFGARIVLSDLPARSTILIREVRPWLFWVSCFWRRLARLDKGVAGTNTTVSYVELPELNQLFNFEFLLLLLCLLISSFVLLSGCPSAILLLKVLKYPAKPSEIIFDLNPLAVSYTHLTLPTNREV